MGNRKRGGCWCAIQRGKKKEKENMNDTDNKREKTDDLLAHMKQRLDELQKGR